MTQQEEIKAYRGRLSEFQKELLLFLSDRAKKMSSSQLGFNATTEHCNISTGGAGWHIIRVTHFTTK